MTGFWVDDRLYEEQVFRVSVACETLADVTDGREMVIAAGHDLGQLAMYFTYHADGIEIIDLT